MDNLDLLIQLGTAGSFVGIIIGLTQLTKYLNINERLIPFISMGISQILAFMLIGSAHPIMETVIVGLIAGLAANGLYGATKKTIVG